MLHAFHLGLEIFELIGGGRELGGLLGVVLQFLLETNELDVLFLHFSI